MNYDINWAKQTKMTHQNTLREWHPDALVIWKRANFSCTYCKRLLLDHEGLSQGYNAIDHLLPRSIYPEFESKLWNKVLTCQRCNRAKHYYDPAEDEVLSTEEPTEEQIDRWLNKAKEYSLKTIEARNSVFEEWIRVLNTVNVE